MKILGNIGAFCAIAKSVASLKNYKKEIESLKAQDKPEEERDAILRTCKDWSGQMVDYLGLTINVVNPENLPKEGPAVYVSNHQSYADVVPFLNVLNHQIGFIAKEELTKIPVFSAWVARIRSLFIERGDARASLNTINQGANMIRDGYSLVIFPEGTRSKGGEMAHFKAGSLKLATKAKAIIVPVTINNTYKVFEETGKVTKNVTIDFIVHEPIDTGAIDRKEQADLVERIEATVRGALK